MPLNEELVKKAEELEITYNVEDIDDDKLNTLIKEKEKAMSSKTRDPEYLEAELNSVIQKRDKVKKDNRKLKEKLDQIEAELKEARSNAADPEEVKKLKDDLKDLKAFKKEMDEKEEEAALKDKTEKERQEAKFNKELKKFNEQIELLKAERDEVIQNSKKEAEELKKANMALRKRSLDSEIMKSSVKYNALKPEQIVRLTRSEFIWDDRDESFVYLKKDRKGKIIDELTVDEFINEYLSDEDNENLVRGDVKQGFNSKTRKAEKSSTADVKITDRIKKEADDRGLSPEVWLKIKTKQDKKLNKDKK